MSNLWRSFLGGLATSLRTDPVVGVVLLGAFITTTFYLGGGNL